MNICDPLASVVASALQTSSSVRLLVENWCLSIAREGGRQTLRSLRILVPDFSGLSAGQHYTDDFAQVNPLRKVPALKDGDFILAER